MSEQAFGGEREGAARYLQALREHWLLIAAIVVAAVAAAVFYSATAQKRYQASTDVLITPVSTSDNTFVGIGLLRESSDQSRSVLTAARLVKTPEVAARVKEDLGLADSPEHILKGITVTPLGQSNIVSVGAEESSPSLAADLANAFADQTIALRTERFQDELTTTINRLRAQLRALGPNPSTTESTALEQRIADLSGLVGAQDPTLQVTSRAVDPTTPVWPRPVLSIAVALLASVMLGFGAALALDLINPKVKREDELLLEQRLPILARVPRMAKKRVQGYLTGRQPLPGDVRESYRTLRTSIATAGRDRGFPRTILVTSAIPGEAKTMTAVNLAITLSLAGQRVVLVDGDLRRPMVATVFGIASRPQGLASVLVGDASIEDALVAAPGHGENLRLLLASPEHAHLIDLLDRNRVERVLDELRFDADVVIVDSPPVTAVADALTLARSVEAVIVAVRFGRTRRDKLQEARRMLAQAGISPVGFVVTTRSTSRGQGYYYGSSEPQEMAAPGAARPAARSQPAESPRAAVSSSELDEL